ncbi:MAG TPA: M23 family metallopeptidase [Anaerolineae bacterium]|nr:M23 family metallopeptidase [Anaerolineae bacterium]
MTQRQSHIILLPQGAAWEWYEALRDYVLRFRPTVTHSADDAVSFRGDAHTVTVVNPASWNKPGAPRQPDQEDDIIAWLKDAQQAGGARFDIDVIRASEPDTLRVALAGRVLESDRYGTGKPAAGSPPSAPPPPSEQIAPAVPPATVAGAQQKLALVWPTDFKVYTQKFGARPEFYGKFGLPGHEGVDIRAPTGANVYACADGVVTLVGWRKAGHPYGYSVRLRHKRSDGEYETVYAHLQEGSAMVKEGDTVKAGQPIALADNTGNSSAAHLHLSLKKIGAKNGGYGEIIDPEPFFVDGPK